MGHQTNKGGRTHEEQQGTTDHTIQREIEKMLPREIHGMSESFFTNSAR